MHPSTVYAYRHPACNVAGCFVQDGTWRVRTGSLVGTTFIKGGCSRVHKVPARWGTHAYPEPVLLCPSPPAFQRPAWPPSSQPSGLLNRLPAPPASCIRLVNQVLLLTAPAMGGLRFMGLGSFKGRKPQAPS